uniref:Armc9 protein n=1 Tax=Fopius arisanus TaxID=64838 RepID=A0A0C9Q1W5_9HYME
MGSIVVTMLLFAALVNTAFGQGDPSGAGETGAGDSTNTVGGPSCETGNEVPEASQSGPGPDTDIPEGSQSGPGAATDIPEGIQPEPGSEPNAEMTIDIEAVTCLCNLQISVDTEGKNATATAGGEAQCGFGIPIPTLSIDCDAVLKGDTVGAFFYILEVERNSILGGSSWVTFDRDKNGWEIVALNFPKGLSESKDLKIISGSLAPDSDWKARIYNLEDRKSKKLTICKNNEKPGTYEYNLLEMSNQIILDGKGCPVAKGTKTSVVEQPPEKLPPAIYQFPEMLPCEKLSWDVKMNDPDKRMAFQVWYDFTPKGACKPVAPKT